MRHNTDFSGKKPVRNKCEKFLFSFIFLFISVVVFGQEPPQVTITHPLNGTVFDGEQIKVEYVVSATTPNSARILIDDIPVQLLTDVKPGKNTVTVDVPHRNCKISVVARNEHGTSLPAVVHLTWSDRIFKPTLYVLAIGVSKYANPDLELQFAAKDAIDFSEAMLGQQGLLYEKVELKLLTDRQATAENIHDGLHWLQTQTTYRDVAMLYLAGHGINNNIGEFYFMPVNADMDRLNATCVSYREIKETIGANAGKMLVFMDACHSGNVWGNNQRSSILLTQAITELTGADNGAVVFTSSTGRQFSLENPEWNNGVFTKALVEGLNGAADLYNNKTITVKNLDSYITNRVKELTNGQQAPTTIIPGSVPDFPVAVVTVTVKVQIELPTSSFPETSDKNRISSNATTKQKKNAQNNEVTSDDHLLKKEETDQPTIDHARYYVGVAGGYGMGMYMGDYDEFGEYNIIGINAAYFLEHNGWLGIAIHHYYYNLENDHYLKKHRCTFFGPAFYGNIGKEKRNWKIYFPFSVGLGGFAYSCITKDYPLSDKKGTSLGFLLSGGVAYKFTNMISVSLHGEYASDFPEFYYSPLGFNLGLNIHF